MSEHVLFMSGLPGRMATAVAEAAVEASDIDLQPLALTGAKEDKQTIGEAEIELVHHEQSEHFLKALQAMPGSIVVDYTHPSAVKGNVELYTQNRIPFILGTTGGDYSEIEAMVVKSKTPAVIAPNMALPIVAITSMLTQAREEYPGVFDGYELTVRESHQKEKADTSGTAKALISEWQGMGANFNDDNLNLCRDPEAQKIEWGIPDEYLSGHAYHTYDLNSDDGTAHFSLSHNILGRKIYALGTLHALRFLSKRLDDPVEKSYNMIDVLRNLRK
jgi:4-hydroxy-tetrahydrodipicolinate reductase